MYISMRVVFPLFFRWLLPSHNRLLPARILQGEGDERHLADRAFGRVWSGVGQCGNHNPRIVKQNNRRGLTGRAC